MSYSGQCLFSSLVGRRSANRGQCAQPCRLTYELIDNRGEVLADVGAHLLSPKDLCSIELIDELIATGVDSLKIEGRMKSPGYVATVVANYKQALVDAEQGNVFSLPESASFGRASSQSERISPEPGEPVVSPEPLSVAEKQFPYSASGPTEEEIASVPPLTSTYNRGFSEAYLTGERTNEMMSYERGAGKERAGEIAQFARESVDRAQTLDILGIEVFKRIEFEPAPLRKRKVKFGQQSMDVVAVTATVGAARSALNAEANEAHLDARELIDEDPIRGVVPILPRVCHDDEFEELLGVAYRFGGAVCSTLGQLRVCQERDIPAQAHWSLNVTNPYTCEVLKALGATRIWLSPELSELQIAAIARRTEVPLGIGITGMTEIMVTEHCVLMSQGPCAQNCEGCARRRTPTALRDRKGYSFPVRTDLAGRSHIYNAVPLDLTGALGEILASGVSAIRLDLETALSEFVPQEIARIRHALIDVYAGRNDPAPRDNTTRGHFFRGVT